MPAGVSELHFHGRGRYGKLHLMLKLHLTGRGRYGQPPSHGTRSPAFPPSVSSFSAIFCVIFG